MRGTDQKCRHRERARQRETKEAKPKRQGLITQEGIEGAIPGKGLVFFVWYEYGMHSLIGDLRCNMK